MDRLGASMAAVAIVTGTLGWTAPASATCYRILAPNQWQYITQCTSSGGGGYNYGAAIGAAGAALEAAPVVIDLLGGVLSTGANIASGAASAGGEIASGAASTGNDMINSGVRSASGASSDPSFDNGNANAISLRKLISGKLGADSVNSGDTDGQKTRAASRSECAGMRARLQPHAIDEAWIVDQMARSGCRPNGTKMSLRERTKRAMLAKETADATADQFPNPFKILGGITQPDAPQKKAPKNRSTITGRSGAGDSSGGGTVTTAR